MSEQYFVSMAEFEQRAELIALEIRRRMPVDPVYVYGVPRGGITAALAVKASFENSHCMVLVSKPEDADIIVDDIYDSGSVHDRFREKFPSTPFLVLFDKREPAYRNKWIVMPFEVGLDGKDESSTDIVTRLLEYIGEDPKREGLLETPKRVLKAWKEWSRGYNEDPVSILKTFEDGAERANELVIVHNIPVSSKCEHHLADISGVAHVGYIPDGKIVGLSKLARLVDVFARRLQVQERMTANIADTLNDVLKPKGVGVLIRASHGCMSSRGVKIHGSVTTTSAMRGVLMEEISCRAEFLNLCHMAEKDGK